MSSEKTTNYNLHKWAPDDDFLRSEFNENFAALDVAVHQCAHVSVGSYTGDGAESRIIQLPFVPKAVLVVMQGSALVNGTRVFGGLAVTGSPARDSSSANGNITVQIIPAGFRVRSVPYVANSYGPHLNIEGNCYQYLAIG